LQSKSPASPGQVETGEDPAIAADARGVAPLRGGLGLTAIACIALVVTSAAFMLFPVIDLAVTRLIFTPGSGFTLAQNEGLLALRWAGNSMTAIVGGLALLAILVPAILPRWSGTIRHSHGVFLLTTLAAGSGLIVNGILKNFWGRARPRQTLEFGGDLPFPPAWENVDHCSQNCSFVSGEASTAFWLVALAFIAPKPLRLPVLVATSTFAVAIFLSRIAFGAHYLSDVVIAWAITMVVVAIRRWIFLDRRRAGRNDAFCTGALRQKNLTSAVSPRQDEGGGN
jgi:membrane-associated phospholipid phosphatase